MFASNRNGGAGDYDLYMVELDLPPGLFGSEPSPSPQPALAPPAGYSPGLVGRMYAGEAFERPTPVLGIVHNGGQFPYWRAAAELQQTWSPLEHHIAAQGSIFLDRDGDVDFRFENCLCRVNDKLICAGDSTFTVPMKAGLHSINLYRPMPTQPGPRFSITRADDGRSVLMHRDDVLESELAKEVDWQGSRRAGKLIEQLPDADDPAASKMLEELHGTISVLRDAEKRVTSVHVLDYHSVVQQGLPPGRGSGDPTDISARRQRFTDADAALLPGLPRLEKLIIRGMDISDVGAGYIGCLRGLANLDVSETQITDVGLQRLSQMGTRGDYRLWMARETGRQSTQIRSDSSRSSSVLTALRIGGTGITDEGLKHLGGLKSLKSLSLHDTSIGDAGLVHLIGLKRLEHLGLNGTRVTDAGLAQLKALASLRRLNLEATAVTPEGIERLMDDMPLLEVSADFTVEPRDHPKYLD
jgi:hypothetical protein